MTKAFIVEILTTQLDTAEPEMAEKPEIFEFIQIFNPKKIFFSNFFCLSNPNFVLRVLYFLVYLNRFSSLEDIENDQKNTLR